MGFKDKEDIRNLSNSQKGLDFEEANTADIVFFNDLDKTIAIRRISPGISPDNH